MARESRAHRGRARGLRVLSLPGADSSRKELWPDLRRLGRARGQATMEYLLVTLVVTLFLAGLVLAFSGRSVDFITVPELLGQACSNVDVVRVPGAIPGQCLG